MAVRDPERGAQGNPEQLHERVDEVVQALDPRGALEREIAMQAGLESIRLSCIDRLEAQAIAGDGAIHRFLGRDVDIWGDRPSVAPHLTQLARGNPEFLIDEIMVFIEHLGHSESGEEQDWSRVIAFVQSIHGEPVAEFYETVRDEMLGNQRDTFFSLVSGHWGDEMQAGRWATNLARKLQHLVLQAKMTGEARASQAALAANMENASRLRARSEKSRRAPDHLPGVAQSTADRLNVRSGSAYHRQLAQIDRTNPFCAPGNWRFGGVSSAPLGSAC